MGTQAAARAKAPAKAAAKQARAPKPHPRTHDHAAELLATVDAVLHSGGEPLPADVRATLRERMGHDFGGVRIHAGRLAAESARALDADAYAVGRHIAFAHGRYRPREAAGLHLLVHELTHVLQQGTAPYRPEAPLELSPSGTWQERQADRTADAVAAGRRHAPSASPPGSVQRVQRAEHGTYVSSLGGNPYLAAGEAFYRTWGHPNVRRVANMKDVLDDLDTAKNKIEKFRIVSHGSSVGLELGLLPEIAKDYFFASGTGATTQYTSESGFRKEFAGMHVLTESKFKEIYDALLKDATAGPLLATLGGAKDLPAEESNLGILLRALADERFLADAKLDTGQPANIANADALRTFNDLRRNTYGRLVVEAKPKDDQAAARKAIEDLRKQIPAAMSSASVSFGALSADDAKTFADPFLEAPGSNRLKKSLSKSIEEGAGGPFLKKLRSVRGKIDARTQIEIRGCNVGKDTATMDGLRGFFGNPDALPALSAPDLYQFFFQLNVKTYQKSEDAALEGAFDDPAVGVKAGFEDLTRMKAGEMIRVHVGGKLAELATRYGFNAEKVRKLNPEIDKPDEIAQGTLLWLVQRESVPAGFFKSLGDFCNDYLGNANAWPKVWAANPWIKDPKKVQPTDTFTVPKDLLAQPYASVKAGKAEFVAAVRGGQAVSGLAKELDVKVATRTGVTTQRRTFDPPRPVLHVDDAKRNEAIGKWLAAQKFDPQGRTADVLGRRFGRTGPEFEAGRQGTYVQFLTRGYPNAEDPIFPEDPRYDRHIIQRP